MTRDEHRAKCIEVIADALHDMTDDDPFDRQQELRIASFILSRLYEIARVCPTEATEEMIKVGRLKWPDAEIFKAMAAAGDLTKPPEMKP